MFSAGFRRKSPPQSPLASPSMTLSATQNDKFCQSPRSPSLPSNRLSEAASPALGTLASIFLASGCACSFPTVRERSGEQSCPQGFGVQQRDSGRRLSASATSFRRDRSEKIVQKNLHFEPPRGRFSVKQEKDAPPSARYAAISCRNSLSWES